MVADKLARAEATIEKYKKKSDETSELRRQIRALEDENRMLAERVAGDSATISHGKSDADAADESLREELTELQRTRNRLSADLEAANEKLEEAKDRAEKLQQACATQREQISTLEYRVRELELSAGAGLDDGIPEGVPAEAVPDSQLRAALEKEQKGRAESEEKLVALQVALKKAKDFVRAQDAEIRSLKTARADQRVCVFGGVSRLQCHQNLISCSFSVNNSSRINKTRRMSKKWQDCLRQRNKGQNAKSRPRRK